MIKVHVMSDLHLEFGPLVLPDAVRSGELAELVLLAGDIHTRRRAVPWAADTFAQRVALVGGNHEGYGDSLWASIAAARAQGAEASRDRRAQVRFLERETWSFEARDGTPVRVIGCTLWTDFELLGDPEEAISAARLYSNDCRAIKVKDVNAQAGKRLFDPVDALRLHRMSRRWLEDELASRFDGITILMTHHAPSMTSIPTWRKTELLSASYASRLDDLVAASAAALWVHGHVHESLDYEIAGTRVMCNPRGYWPDELNPNFAPELVATV